MVWAVLLLLVAAGVLAACVRVVPPDSLALVERFGRLLPGSRKPGIVVIRPFVERLLVFPLSPFPIEAAARGELSSGALASATIRLECAFADAVTFYNNVPAGPPLSRFDRLEHARHFAAGLLATEGGAALRELSTAGGDLGRAALASRLTERLEWHLRRVGLRQHALAVTSFDVLESGETLRRAAEA